MISEGIKEAVTMLFQRAFREEDVPDDWRSGVVVPIPKAGDTRQIENYRGITLLSTIGKTFVAILNRRLTGWLETRGILVKEQAGFREGYSTVDQVFILDEVIRRQKRRKKKWICAFLDIKRAYDVAWRAVMWRALWDAGVRGKMWRMLQNIYREVKSCRRLRGKIGVGGIAGRREAGMCHIPDLVLSLHQCYGR